MRSIRLFKLFGIILEIHFTFLLLLLYFAYIGYDKGRWDGVVWHLGFIVLAFVCVICHELGHSLAARRYGIATKRILLMPIGGMAQFTHMPRKPKQELVISLAGPAVNAIFLLILYFVYPEYVNLTFAELSSQDYSFPSLIINLFSFNVVMLAFNLLPIFPMDGGRVFRAILAYRFTYVTATGIAVNVGKILALSGICFAVYYDLLLLAILFGFIFIAGSMEYKMVKSEESWRKYIAGE